MTVKYSPNHELGKGQKALKDLRDDVVVERTEEELVIDREEQLAEGYGLRAVSMRNFVAEGVHFRV